MHLFKRQLIKCGQEISVNERLLDSSGYESSQPKETFTEISTPLSIVKTIESVRGGSKLFGGVSVVDDATHIFCVLYTTTLADVESQNYSVELKGKRFKVLAVTNINEKDQILVIQTKIRGLSAKEATKA